MTLLGFRLENELKDELESNFENELRFAENISSFMELLKERKYEAVVIDETNLQQDALVNLVKKITETHKRSVIIIMGETSNLKLVAGVIKAGAYDYILKPISPKDVNKILEKAVKDHKLLAERVDRNKNTGDKLIGQTKEIVEVYKMIGRVANSRIPVLVVGEKGTGKSSVATAIHQFSDWNTKPFLSVNCTSFQNNLLERKLFGYEKGAFTGASSQGKKGLFEAANDSTLFLDEINSLPLALQGKILRAIETKTISRIGSTVTRKVNFRLITATNEDLLKMVHEKRFREDLYYRLNIVPIYLPPLQERKEDILPLVEYFRKYYCNIYNKTKIFSQKTLKAILDYKWPGNIRELRNFVERSFIMITGEIIELSNIAPLLFIERKPSSNSNSSSDELGFCNNFEIKDQSLNEYLEECEKKYIQY